MKIFNKEEFVLLLLIFIGCSDTNYFMENQTPPNLEGFLGIRWTTPLSIVDDEFPKMTGAKPLQQLNRYNTSAYTNFNFWDRQVKICQFTFNEKGLYSIELVFNTDIQSYGRDFIAVKEKLTKIYGVSMKKYGNDVQQKYISGFSWLGCRLELLLTEEYKIEIIAYKGDCYPKAIPRLE
jgi:hypothetical protein